MATAAAAVVAKARRDVISHFMQLNGVSRGAAVTWVPERRVQRRVLARFVRQGVVIETAENTYYLDIPEYDRWRRANRRRVALALAGIAAIGAAFAALA